MKKFIFVLLLLSLFIFNSCKDDCYTAPEIVSLKIQNANNVNLVEDGTLSSNFTIQEVVGGGNFIGINHTVTSDFKLNLDKNVGRFNGTKKYQFISTVKTFEFTVKSSNSNDGCDGFKIDDIQFQNVSASKENGFYKIIFD